MKNTNRIALVLCVVLVMASAALAQQAPVTNGGGTTKSGRHYDYKKVEADKTTYFRVLRTREEIDTYIAGQAQANPGNEEFVKLRELRWTVMVHEWRKDPVTKRPITEFPPPQDQQQELVEAFKARLQLPVESASEAADEFQRKLAAGDCNMHESLEPRRMIAMVNGTGANNKLEVPEGLAAKTKSCEFFLESVPVVINLVLICGNFGYDFVEVWWETNPTTSEVPPPPMPGKALCELTINGKTFNPLAPFAVFPDQEVVVRGNVIGGGPDLQLKSEWYLQGSLQLTNPTFNGSEEFPFGPKVTHYLVGSYNGLFRVSDQFGRTSECPFVGEVRAAPTPPAISVPPAPPVPEKEYHHSNTWKYVLVAVAGAVIAGYFATHHGKTPPVTPTPVKIPVCVPTTLPNGTTTTCPAN